MSHQRQLVTTADERSWSVDRPVLFLGEWCRRHSRRAVWSQMDAIVAEPYGLEQSIRDVDYARVLAIEAILFPAVCAELNRHHSVNHGPRFWKIVLGHWLRRSISVLFNRYQTIAWALQHYAIERTAVLSDSRYALATSDSLSAILASNDDIWNHVLYARALAHFNRPALETMSIPAFLGTGFQSPASAASSTIRQRLHRVAATMLWPLARDTDGVMIGTYLLPAQEVRLQVALGQTPQRWRSPAPHLTAVPDQGIRNLLCDRVRTDEDDALLSFIRKHIFEMMPVCYLEGLPELQDAVEKLPWPRQASFAFTSNRFDTDEVFKLWLARSVERGTRYIVGQHGGTYGVPRIPYRSIEEETSDRFLTWGWNDGLPQHKPGFLLLTGGHSPTRPTRDGDGPILFVLECLNHRVSTWDDTAEFAWRWNAQLLFLSALPTAIRSKVVVRLHPYAEHLSWSDRERLAEFDPDLRVDAGEQTMKTLLASSRMVIFTYNSSGFYEAMSRNYPTMGLWPLGLDGLRQSIRPIFDQLVASGILHVDPRGAAERVTEVSSEIPQWWNSDVVKEARKRFCERLARSTDTPISALKSLIAK